LEGLRKFIELGKDVLFLMLITAPSFYFIVPWLIDARPSMGIDFYGGGAILMNNDFIEIALGYMLYRLYA
jgi:hypothetical protein